MRKLTKREERRKQRYPDTNVFVFDNQNPKGQLTDDCMYRAISLAAGIPWMDVFDGISDLERKSCRNDHLILDRYLKSIGWEKHKAPMLPNGRRFTGEAWCSYLTEMGSERHTILANIGTGHIVCIRKDSDGFFRIHDTWDCSDRCIGNFWVQEEV